MTLRLFARLLGGMFVVAHLAAVSPNRAAAEEPAREFLDALRQENYYDAALDYLEEMQDSSLAPVELKEVLAYERAVTLYEASRDQGDLAIREKQLDQAQAHLDDFVTNRPNNPLVFAANNHLGNILVERARINMERAEKSGGAQNERQARQFYDQAIEVFQRQIEKIRGELERIPKILDPDADAQLISRRDQLRSDYLQAQLLEAAAMEEKADTLEAGTDEHKELLTQAAEKYKEIYEKYRTFLAGQYARLYQGRAYQKMGDCKEALSYFTEVLENPDDGPFRDMKTKALLLASECWLEESQKKYAEVIDRGGEWLQKANLREETQPDWLKLRYYVSLANKRYGEQLEQDGKTKQAKLALADARKMVQMATEHASDVQEDARSLLADLGVERKEEEKATPTTFAEAKDAGKESLDEMQTAGLIVKTLPGRIAAEKKAGNAEQVKQLEQQLAEAKETIASAPQEAIDNFRLALSFVDQETSTDDLGLVLYFLSYLYYSQEDYLDAAVTGEFLARQYPNSAGARQAAKIAMAAYLKLYNERKAELEKEAAPGAELPEEALAFETRRVVEAADYITAAWADQKESIEALNTLIPFMIRRGDLEQALAYMDQIPADSPHRGAAELKTGQAMWSAYLSGRQELRQWEKEGAEPPPSVDLAARREELNSLKQRAQETLENGIDRMKESGVDATLATAVLSLAQIYVDTEQPQKAVELLEDGQIGVLALLVKNHDAVQKPGFAEEAYKTALRAYIGALPEAQDTDNLMAKAKGVMNELKKSVTGRDNGQKQLVGVYLSLANDLERQMNLAESTQSKRELSEGFEMFLDQVAAEAGEFHVLNWVAETFAKMGDSFESEDSGSLPPQARKYYIKAADIFEKILDRDDQNADFLDDNHESHVLYRLATIKRGLGDYQAALATYERLLAQNPMMLNVQIAAAEALQDWGRVEFDRFEDAVAGAKLDEQTGKPIIWGWSRIAKLTANKSQFRDQFHQARFNHAATRLQQAQASSDSAKKDSYLRNAKRAVQQTVALYPLVSSETGEPFKPEEGLPWRTQYDTLLKRIQREMGEPTVGLREFEPKTVAAE